MSTRIVAIGIGCRAGASAANIVSLVQRTLSDAQLDGGSAKLFSIDSKREEAGLIKAARLLADSGRVGDFEDLAAMRTLHGDHGYLPAAPRR